MGIPYVTRVSSWLGEAGTWGGTDRAQVTRGGRCCVGPVHLGLVLGVAPPEGPRHANAM